MLENTFIFIKEYPYVVAPFLGIIPALFWLWFWLREDTHPESHKMVTLSFIGGMIAVILVLPLERLVYDYTQDQNSLAFFLWAALEEIFKFITVYIIALRNKTTVDEPIDDMIYLIISALGFVSLENTLFLINPLHSGDISGTIITGNLRFMGASLLHIISSATIGTFMALSFYKSRARKILYLVTGLIVAIGLHTLFNLFIMNEYSGSVFITFGMVWIGIIALLLLFEKIKHIIPNTNQ